MKEAIPKVHGELVDWDSARKSSFSGANGNCVEAASGNGFVGFQDSKQEGSQARARIAVEAGAAAMFFAAVKAGVYDL